MSNLTANDYQQLAARAMNPRLDIDEHCHNAILGLIGEVGELADMLKKHEFHAHPLDTTMLFDEIGDCEWYIAQMCYAFGWDMAEFDHSVEKWRDVDMLYAAECVGLMAGICGSHSCVPEFMEDATKYKFSDHLEALHGILISLAAHYGATIQQVWQGNIDNRRIAALSKQHTCT